MTAIWTGTRAANAARGPQRRRLEVLRRLPAEAAAQEGPAVARARPRRASRCLRGSTSSARPPVTSRARRRAARPRPASRGRARPGCWTSTCSRRVVDEAGPSLVPHRFLQLRRGVPAQARRRDVRAHQVAAFHTSISTRARTGWRSDRGPGQAARCGRGSTRSRSRSTARRRKATRSYRQRGRLREGDPQLAVRGRREARERARTCRSSTGATSCSRTTTAMPRWRRRARWRPISAWTACAGS